MLKRMKNTENTRSFTGRIRRILALFCAFSLLCSSAVATSPEDIRTETEIISDPITPPIPLPSLLPSITPEAVITPAPEDTDAPVMPEDPEATGDPEATADPENSEEPGVPEETTDPENPAETDVPEETELPEETAPVFEAGYLSASGEGWEAILRYPAEAEIPADAVLTLTEIRGTALYSLMKTAASLLRNDRNSPWTRKLSDGDSHFYTAAVTDAAGNRIEPKAEVTLRYTNLHPNANQAYFSMDEGARILSDENGVIRISAYTGETFGYGTVEQVQVGTVTLQYSNPDYIVTASYGPEAGFPVGTQLNVREIRPGTPEYAICSGLTGDALNEDWNEITLERYFDITFVSDGAELEPQAPVDVQILFRDKIELTEENDVQAVHITNNEATVIESETDSNLSARRDSEAIDTVTFASDSFSYYGVVQRTKITSKVLASDGNTYEISVTYGQDADIPEGAQVIVEEIPEGCDRWEAYRKQTAAALGADDVRLPGLYDISIRTDGGRIEPKAPVSVSIRLMKAEGNEDLQVVHFTEELREELLTPQDDQQPGAALSEGQQIASEPVDITVEGDTVSFTTEGFSVYAFAYTVEFTYEGKSCTMLGNEERMLSTLLASLEIAIPVENIINVSSESSFIKIIPFDGDWLIKVLPSGDETSSLIIETEKKVISVEMISAGIEQLVLEESGTSIRAASEVYLPSDAEGYSQVISPEAAQDTIQAVEAYANAQTVQDEPETVGTEETGTEEAGTEAEGTGEGQTPAPETDQGEAETENPESSVADANPEDSGNAEEATEESEVAEPTFMIRTGTEVNYQIYDIGLTNVNLEDYPEGFNVRVALQAEVNTESVSLYHLHDGVVSEITNFSLESNELIFQTNDFSEFILRYTVDFTYMDELGNTYAWSFPGRGSYPLTDILAEMKIEGIPTAAELTLVEGEDHEGALYLTRDDETDSWTLNSDIAFQDTYQLKITVGDKVYLLLVTDEEGKWTVTVKLFDYDGLEPATADELALVNGKTYAIMAIISDQTTGNVLGYRVAGTSFANNSNIATCEVDLSNFNTLGYDENGGITATNGQAFPYDDEKQNISFRLYEGTVSVDQWPYQVYSNIVNLPDYVDGFEFLAEPNGNVTNRTEQTTTLNLKRAYDKEFNVRLNVDQTGLQVSDADKVYALVTVNHQTTGTTYAYAQITIPAGQTVVDVPFTQWYNLNGNALPNEKFTGNETVDVKLYTTNADGNGDRTTFNSLNELKNNQVKVHIAEGSSINRYNVYYTGMLSEPTTNDEEKKTCYYYQIDFHTPIGDISKGMIDSYLEDATDFGYYTEQYMGQSGDIEATIGAAELSAKFSDGFGYSSANVNVNRLNVLKIFTNSDGTPVSGENVTIKLKQAGDVVAEKSGATDENGVLRIEFDGLRAGDYEISEVFRGQEISANGTSSIGDTQYSANFSSLIARFVANGNMNYFGKILYEDDGDLQTALDKASRVDLLVLTDTEESANRINNLVSNTQLGNKGVSIVGMQNGTEGHKKYDIKSDMVKLRELSNSLAAAQSSQTVRVMTYKASEITEEGLSFDDDGRYIVLNILMDQQRFCPTVKLDGVTLESDYGQSGRANSSHVLYNLRSADGGPYTDLFDTSKVGAGVILAPWANAHYLESTFGGTIISQRVNRSGNELHSNNPNQIQTLNITIQNVNGTPTTGSLELRKAFSNTSIKDKMTYFTFEVTLNHTDPDRVHNQTFLASGLKDGKTVSFDENGKAEVLVRAGNSVTIANLPEGTTYTVQELETPETVHYNLDYIVGRTGTITAGQTASAAVYNNIKRADLSIEKEVSGTTDDTKEFEFTLKLENNQAEEGASEEWVVYPDPYQITIGGEPPITVSGGTESYTFRLKAGERADINGLDLGKVIRYTVTETGIIANGQHQPITGSSKVYGYSNDSLVKQDSFEQSGERVIFINQYQADTELQIIAHKQMLGRAVKADEFTFELREGSPEGTVIDTKTNALDGSITFNKIAYQIDYSDETHIIDSLAGAATQANGTREKTYHYFICELKDDNNSEIKYAEPVEVIVKVVDDGIGHLSVTDAEGTVLTTQDEMGYVYDLPSTQNLVNSLKTSQTIQGTKTLTGRDMIEGETFEFSVTEQVNGASVEVSRGIATGGKDGEPVNIVFAPIEYTYNPDMTYPQTYTYTITEDTSKLGTGVTHDPVQTFTATVIVDVENVNGGKKLVASDPVYSADVAFNNTWGGEKTGIKVIKEYYMIPADGGIPVKQISTSGPWTFQLYRTTDSITQQSSSTSDGTVVSIQKDYKENDSNYKNFDWGAVANVTSKDTIQVTVTSNAGGFGFWVNYMKSDGSWGGGLIGWTQEDNGTSKSVIVNLANYNVGTIYIGCKYWGSVNNLNISVSKIGGDGNAQNIDPNNYSTSQITSLSEDQNAEMYGDTFTLDGTNEYVNNNLPKYNDNGDEYHYFVVESSAEATTQYVLSSETVGEGDDAYEQSVWTVKNYFSEPTDMSITVQKEWSDGEEAHTDDTVTIKLIRYKKDSGSEQDGEDGQEDPTESETAESSSTPESTGTGEVASIDIYQSNYGHNSKYTNFTDFHEGDSLVISWTRQGQAPGGYTVNGGDKVQFTGSGENRVKDTLTITVPTSGPYKGKVEINLDDVWGDCKDFEVKKTNGTSRFIYKKSFTFASSSGIPAGNSDIGLIGYVVDSSYSRTITLSNEHWSETVTGLNITDDSGNVYYYAIEEGGFEGYTVTYSANYLQAQAGTFTLKAINTKTTPGTGSISLTKNVVVNDAESDELSGQTITVGLFTSQPDASSTPSITATVNLTGAATTQTVFTNLSLGTYWVYELDADNHPVLDGGSITVDGKGYTVSETTPNVTVTAGATSEVVITNSRTVYGSLTVTKAVLYNGEPDTTVTDQQIYVGLYTDASASQPVKDPLDNTRNWVKTITLSADGTGEVTFEELEYGTAYYAFELTGENGTPITGTSGTVNGVEYTVGVTGNGATLNQTTQTATVAITNSISEEGSLEVTKEIQVNGTASNRSGSFQIALYEVVNTDAGDGTVTETETLFGDILTIVVTDGTSKTATFAPLTIGRTYRVYEVTSDGGVVTKVGNRYGQYNVSYENQTVTIPRGAGKNVTGTKVINNVQTTNVTVKKTWNHSEAWLNDDYQVLMTLKANGGEVGSIPDYNGSAQTAAVLLTSANAGTGYTWYELPKYDSAGALITYTVEETTVKYGENSLPDEMFIVTGDGILDNEGVTTFDNTPVETMIEVTKEWTLNGTDRTDRESIGFQVHQVKGTEDTLLNKVWTSVGDGTPVENESPVVRYNSGTWQTVKVSKLPKYAVDGTAYTYYVVETGDHGNIGVSYKVGNGDEKTTPSEASTDDGRITILNKDYATEISVFKVDESTRGTNTKKPLSGAEFRIERKDNDFAAYPDAQSSIKSSGNDGKLRFENLQDGQYRITETKAPAGYYNGNIVIYFRIENGVVTWTDSSGNVITEQTYVGYDSESKTFIVGNTPGAELPATGGPGTLAYILGGLALVLLAGALLVFRKRRKA